MTLCDYGLWTQYIASTDMGFEAALSLMAPAPCSIAIDFFVHPDGCSSAPAVKQVRLVRRLGLMLLLTAVGSLLALLLRKFARERPDVSVLREDRKSP